MQLLAAVVNNG